MLALLSHMSARVGEIAAVISFLIAASFEEAGVTPAELRERAVADDLGAMPAILDRAAAAARSTRAASPPGSRPCLSTSSATT